METFMRLAESDQSFYIAEQGIIGSESAPVHPGRLIVLTVDIIVALLRISELITCKKTRRSLRGQQKLKCILT